MKACILAAVAIVAPTAVEIQNPGSPLPMSEYLVVSGPNRDKAIYAQIYLPSSFPRRAKETLAYIILTNKGSKERLVINGAWANTVIFPSRLDGPPLLKPLVMMFDGPLPKRSQIAIRPGYALHRDFPLQHLWDFEYTEEGRYKLELIYDDSDLWPSEQKDAALGKMSFKFHMIVERGVVRFEPG